MYKCTFFAVYTFFVGTEDEKMYKVTFFVGITGNFDEKCINYFLYMFRFLVATKNV